MKYVGFLRASIFCLQEARVYILRRDRGKSVFSTNWIEKTLKMLTTARNLSTIFKIVEKYK
jgi:hypothetical protein